MSTTELVAEFIEENDQEWEETRDRMAKRFVGVSAREFIAKYRAGEYDENPPDSIMEALAFFPELDS